MRDAGGIWLHVFVVSAATLFLYLIVRLKDVGFTLVYFPACMFMAFLGDCSGVEAFLRFILDGMWRFCIVFREEYPAVGWLLLVNAPVLWVAGGWGCYSEKHWGVVCISDVSGCELVGASDLNIKTQRGWGFGGDWETSLKILHPVTFDRL